MSCVFSNNLYPNPPTSVTSVTSVTSGKTTNFVGKNANENGYFFFTYARCRRRLPSIKMINGVDEVFVRLSPRRITNTCFGSTVLRVSKVRLFIREKIRFVSKRHTTKRRRTTNQKYLAKKCFNKSVWGFVY